MAGEKRLQDKILSDLRSLQKYIVVAKIQKTGDNGVPDVFFTTLFTGAVFVEVKNTGKKPSKLQLRMIKKLNRTGVQAFACSTLNQWKSIKYKLGLTPENVRNAASLFK